MMLVDCVAVSYTQGVGGRKALGVIVWAWYKVSPCWDFGIGRRWTFTFLSINRQIGL